jgi:Domain of unknown function (DUF4277)
MGVYRKSIWSCPKRSPDYALGFINQALYLVPRFFQHKPTSRLIAPRVAPAQLNDDALGRALDTLYAYGVTEL